MFSKPATKSESSKAPAKVEMAGLPAPEGAAAPRKAPKVASLVAENMTLEGSISGEGELHVDGVIRPALAAGRWVLSDRFTDATFAYQGGGRGVPFERIAELERWVQRDLKVDRTFLIDISPDVARARMSATRTLDRFEREREAFHQRVRNAYLSRAEADIDRIRVLDAELPVATLQAELARDLGRLLERR